MLRGRNRSFSSNHGGSEGGVSPTCSLAHTAKLIWESLTRPSLVLTYSCPDNPIGRIPIYIWSLDAKLV